MSHDEFAYADGAYVLGALDPDEQQAFEQHMLSCEICARSVRALAELPELLSQVDASMFESAEDALTVPDTLLPGLLREVRRRQRRRTIRGLAVSAAAILAAVLVAVAGVVGLGRDEGTPPAARPEPSASTASPGQEMEQVGQSAVRATLTMESVPWGTRLDLTCTYTDSGDTYSPTLPSYALVVHTRDGRTEQVGTWKAVLGRTTTLSAATAAEVADIVAVDVRTLAGDPVLRLTS